MRPAVERDIGQHRLDQPLALALGQGASHVGLGGQEFGEVDRVALQFLEVDEEAVVGHPLRIEDAVEVVAFVLHDAGMKPRRLALDRLAVEADAAIAHPQIARHNAAQPGDRQAPLPAERPLGADRLDDRVDQHRQRLLAVAGKIADPLAGN